MFKPHLTTYCPACQARIDVHATQHTDGDGVITTTRKTEHECDGLVEALRRGDDSAMRTILLSAQ
jgi:hypothetical protein